MCIKTSDIAPSHTYMPTPPPLPWCPVPCQPCIRRPRAQKVKSKEANFFCTAFRLAQRACAAAPAAHDLVFALAFPTPPPHRCNEQAPLPPALAMHLGRHDGSGCIFRRPPPAFGVFFAPSEHRRPRTMCVGSHAVKMRENNTRIKLRHPGACDDATRFDDTTKAKQISPEPI